MRFIFKLAMALSIAAAAEQSAFGEAVSTYYDVDRVGKTMHNTDLPKDVALSQFLGMSEAFYGARDEANELDEEKMKVVDELFDAFDTNSDGFWSEAEYSDYFVGASRLEATWKKMSGGAEEVDKDAMDKYVRGVFSGDAANTISAFLAVAQGIALTAGYSEEYMTKIIESFDYPVTWEAYKTSSVHDSWEYLPGDKVDGLATEETILNYLFGATKDLAIRMETIETSAVASQFDSVGDLIEGVSGVDDAERRRASQGEAVWDGLVCAFGAAGEFLGPLSDIMSVIGCIDMLINADGECNYHSLSIRGNGALSCMASFLPGFGFADNVNCVINNVVAIASISSNDPPQCKWFGTAPFCERHECTGDYPMLGSPKFDKCGDDGNRCTSGTKTYCCEEYYHVRVTDPPREPMRIWNDYGDSMPLCDAQCELNSSGNTCYDCWDGFRCRTCTSSVLRRSKDCRPENCYHVNDNCKYDWEVGHACSGSIIKDVNLSKLKCVQACRQNSSCNCVTYGVDPFAPCRLETGTYHRDHGRSHYSAVTMNECGPRGRRLMSRLGGEN